jgi:hypothetical protein
MAEYPLKKHIVGIYDDDEKLMHACEHIRHMGIKIKDVFTPFPVHGLEEVLGIKPSRLPDVAFAFGLTGTITALTLMTYCYTFDWPVNVGGKPGFPLPSFIPITFELTVLFCAFGMVFTYLFVNNLAPHIKPEIVDPRQTDDRFVVVIEATEDAEADQKIHNALKESGTCEPPREQYLRAHWYNVP